MVGSSGAVYWIQKTNSIILMYVAYSYDAIGKSTSTVPSRGELNAGPSMQSASSSRWNKQRTQSTYILPYSRCAFATPSSPTLFLLLPLQSHTLLASREPNRNHRIVDLLTSLPCPHLDCTQQQGPVCISPHSSLALQHALNRKSSCSLSHSRIKLTSPCPPQQQQQ